LVPIIMANFVAEMAEESAVRFPKRNAAAFAFDIVSFGDVERDDSIGVTGESVAAEEFEFQFFRPSIEEMEAKEIVNAAALGRFDFGPEFEIAGDGHIGNELVAAAGEAKVIWIGRRDEPIARGMFKIVGATAIKSAVLGTGHGLPLVALGIERQQIKNVRGKTEARLAFEALKIFKEHQTPAAIAIKGPHFPFPFPSKLNRRAGSGNGWDAGAVVGKNHLLSGTAKAVTIMPRGKSLAGKIERAEP